MKLQRDDPTDDIDLAVAEARARFEREFPATCTKMQQLLDGSGGDSTALTMLVTLLHRMAGLGGSIGFAHVSEHARTIEDLLRDHNGGRLDVTAVRQRLEQLTQAFEQDRGA